MRKVILISILTFVFAGVSTAQGWQRRYGNAADSEQGKFITRTTDGGYLVRAAAGNGDPAYSTLFRLDADGDSVWVHTAGPFPAAGGQNALVEDRAVFNAAGDVFSVFYDSLFQFDAGGQKIRAVPADFYRILGVQGDGLFLWKGVDTKDTLKLRKYGFDGGLAWEKAYKIANELTDVKLAPDGRILALYQGPFFTQLRSRLAVYDTNGNLQTTHNYSPNRYYKIAFDSNGNYILYETFLSDPDKDPNNTVFLLKSRPNGQEIWAKTYSIPSTEAVERIVPSAAGKLVLVGSTWYDTVYSPRLYALDSSGNEIWKRSFQMTRSTRFKDAVANPDGSFLVTGSVAEQADAPGPTDAIVWKFTANGQLFPNLLRGRIARDTLPDCAVQPDEPGMSGWTLKLGPSLGVSDAQGRYEVDADTGATALELYPPGSLWQTCPGFEGVIFKGLFVVDTLDIPVYPVISCPQMEVSVSFQRLRRCFENVATVNWCNVGTISEPEAKILVVLPPGLDFTSASWPPSQVNGDSLWFDIGFVGVNACGSFQLKAVVDCDSTALGEALCTEVHIFPDTFCLPAPGWSGAHVQVGARCVGDTAVEFHLKNTGTVQTSPGLQYIIIEDQVVLMTQPFSLQPGAEIVFSQKVTNASLYRLIAQQEPFHPGHSMPIAWVEGCGPAQNHGLSLQYPVDDRDLFTDIDCQVVTGSYDPNDKAAQPEGFGPEHLIEPNSDLTYRIRFQNTGTDTAFTVIVRDTLSPWLDPATIRPEAASHPYRWNFAEGNILKFTFDNILLPDSATNLAGSQGFIQFRIDQKKDLPLGTIIRNQAAIYFDFNPPVITNEVFHTLGRDFILVETEAPDGTSPGLTVSPNPFREAATFHLDENTQGLLSLYNLQGQCLRREFVAGPHFLFQRQGLPAGVYAFDIREQGRLLARGKIIIQ